MDLEDLLKNDHHKHRHHPKDQDEYHHDRHHDDHTFRHGKPHHQGHYNMEMLRSIFQSLPHKKALLTGVIIVSVLALIIGLSLVWALFPLLAKFVGYVEVNGIQGLVDTLLSFAQKLWKGNG